MIREWRRSTGRTGRGHDLVGRERELAVLEETLRDACTGTFRTLWISGKPGIGKSRLLAELAQRAEDAGCVVVAGRAAEFERDEVFGVFRDALDDYAGSLSVRSCGGWPGCGRGARRRAPGLRRARLCAGRRGRQRALSHAPGAAGAAGGARRRAPAGADARRPALGGRAVARAPGRAAAATLRGDASCWRCVPAQAGAALADRSPGVAAGCGWNWHRWNWRRPGPCSGTGSTTRRWRRCTPRAGACRSTWRSSRARRARRTALRDWAACQRRWRWRCKPRSMDCPGRRRAASRGRGGGDPFEVGLAAEAAGMPERDALPALDELVALDLVRGTATARRFRFRHPLVRHAVYESASPGFRIAAHERAAAALERAGAGALARARHVAASAGMGDDGAVAVLVDAAHGAMARAPVVAAHWFGEALRLLGEQPAWRLNLLVARAWALVAAGRLEPGLEVLHEALSASPCRTPRCACTCSATPPERTRCSAARPRHAGGWRLSSRRCLITTPPTRRTCTSNWR